MAAHLEREPGVTLRAGAVCWAAWSNGGWGARHWWVVGAVLHGVASQESGRPLRLAWMVVNRADDAARGGSSPMVAAMAEVVSGGDLRLGPRMAARLRAACGHGSASPGGPEGGHARGRWRR